MRKYWFAVIASAGLVTGCAGAGWSGLTGVSQSATRSAQSPGDASGYAGPLTEGPAKPSWKERINKTFTQNPLTTFGLKRDKPAPPKPVDSISLNYRTGEPTPELVLSMAAMSYQTGNTEQARQLYQKALAGDENNVQALLGLARIEDREGRLPEALAIYQQAAESNPDDATVLNDLALCHARSGQLNDALLTLHQATKVEPQRPLFRNNIAKVLVELNRLDDALAELSVVHPPAVAQYNLAVLLNDRNRPIEAANFASQALRSDPALLPARQLLSHLQPSLNTAQSAVPQAQQEPRVVQVSSADSMRHPAVSYEAQGGAAVGGMASDGLPAHIVAPPQRRQPEMPAARASNPVGVAPQLLPSAG